MINGRVSYKHMKDQEEKYGIWWACEIGWCASKILEHNKGRCFCSAFNKVQSKCISSIHDGNTWTFKSNGEWMNSSFAGYFQTRKAIGITNGQ